MTLDNHHCVQLVPLFEKLAEQDLTKVEKIVEHKKIKKGEIIISPDKEPLLVIVAQGALKISQLSQSGKEQLLRIIEAGDYEGEGALLGVTNGQLYGQAMIDSTICFLRQSDFETLLTTYPSLSLQLLKLNAKKYLAAEHQAGFLALDDVEARL
ncbi:MAG TPA: Crp/Fnr family transcriptional regulator, partial [Lactococcus lactis]|nr:Crp/Fnr family transcriptional regulator [Lactococcus lactis]